MERERYGCDGSGIWLGLVFSAAFWAVSIWAVLRIFD